MILYLKTIERQRLLSDNGYIVVSIWESDFDKMLDCSPADKLLVCEMESRTCFSAEKGNKRLVQETI